MVASELFLVLYVLTLPGLFVVSHAPLPVSYEFLPSGLFALAPVPLLRAAGTRHSMAAACVAFGGWTALPSLSQLVDLL